MQPLSTGDNHTPAATPPIGLRSPFGVIILKAPRFSVGRVMEVQLVDFPTSAALTHLFGIGSVLGTYFAAQAGSGLLLSFGYVASANEAFISILAVITESDHGYLLYIVHSVGAGTVFALLYAHMAKAAAIRSYNTYALLTGSLILVLVVVSAFLGYVLLWQQMSYWAATVITTLISVLPNGDEILTALWGAFTLDSTTLTRFYSMHYLVTLLSSAMAIGHMVALHVLGSTSSQLFHESPDSVPFARYYLIKDAILFSLVYLLYLDVLYTQPTLFSDVELNISVNTMATPPHIVPEWYLLAYYATLRGIPSKALGVLLVAYVLLNVALGYVPNLPEPAQ